MSACNKIGCTEEAKHVLELNIPAKGHHLLMHTPLSMVISLELCAAHAKEVTVEEVLNEQLRSVVQASLTGRAPPDFKRAFIKLLPLDDPKYLRLKLARNRG